MAAIHVLLEKGTRVVLPPPFLCCGFPHRANAREEQHGKIVLKDVIVFSQIREMLRHLTFDAVVVTCGTCLEALGKMEVEKVFGCEGEDVVAFAGSRGLSHPKDGTALYHTPCHDSFGGAGLRVLGSALGIEATEVPHCCSEAGTLALSAAREAGPRGTDAAARPAVLTNCPSCLTGLKRNEDLGVEARHVAVEAARRLSPDWRALLVERARTAARIRF